MPRLVQMDGTGPIKIEPQDKPIFICGCGLSQNLPFCDGSHKKCKDEVEGKIFVYDATRQNVIEERDQQ